MTLGPAKARLKAPNLLSIIRISFTKTAFHFNGSNYSNIEFQLSFSIQTFKFPFSLIRKYHPRITQYSINRVQSNPLSANKVTLTPLV